MYVEVESTRKDSALEVANNWGSGSIAALCADETNRDFR